MALIKCKECGHEVSDKASACPNCGCPIKETKNCFNWKKSIISFTILILVLGGFYVVLQLIGNYGKYKEIEITDALSESVHNYDAITEFHEGYAAVIKNGKWGYINSHGEETIPCKYFGVSPFSEGLACVYVDEENMSVEFIDKKGHVRISGYYGFTMNSGMTFLPITFRNGVCCVADKNKCDVWIDINGNKVNEPTDYEEVFENDGTETFKEDGKVGIKDSLGNIIVRAKYSFIDKFSEGLAPVYLDCGEKTIYGFVDKNGKDTFSEDDFANFSNYINKRKEEAQKAEEERIRQEEEARRLDWIQGTWTEYSYSSTSKVIINVNRRQHRV